MDDWRDSILEYQKKMTWSFTLARKVYNLYPVANQSRCPTYNYEHQVIGHHTRIPSYFREQQDLSTTQSPKALLSSPWLLGWPMVLLCRRLRRLSFHPLQAYVLTLPTGLSSLTPIHSRLFQP